MDVVKIKEVIVECICVSKRREEGRRRWSEREIKLQFSTETNLMPYLSVWDFIKRQKTNRKGRKSGNI